MEDNSDSLESEVQEWSSGSQTSSEESLSWIMWWCAHQGHEYLTRVPRDFIEDDFNMTGLSSEIPFYRHAIDLVLDLEPDPDYPYEAADQEAVEESSEVLYALVHQRYISSRNGLLAMAEKYEAEHFGHCPRLLCDRTAVLPIGLSDDFGEEMVKLFCPSCLDVYNPPNSRFYDVDGSNFGTTFPHLFFMTFPELRPPMPEGGILPVYVPRIYGFRVSEQSACGPRMGWLRKGIQCGRPTASDVEALRRTEEAENATTANQTMQSTKAQDRRNGQRVMA